MAAEPAGGPSGTEREFIVRGASDYASGLEAALQSNKNNVECGWNPSSILVTRWRLVSATRMALRFSGTKAGGRRGKQRVEGQRSYAGAGRGILDGDGERERGRERGGER